MNIWEYRENVKKVWVVIRKNKEIDGIYTTFDKAKDSIAEEVEEYLVEIDNVDIKRQIREKFEKDGELAGHFFIEDYAVD
ncbi:MAG: hypothetical protein IIW86_00780 [Clostridia bacterium]|nr:hypothetical protein [Clostridia bacterium]